MTATKFKKMIIKNDAKTELQQLIQTTINCNLRELSVVRSEPKQPDVMTIKQTAEYLGLSVSTLYSYVNKRQIPFSKRNGTLYFLRESLLQWIKDGERKTFNQLTC